MWLIRLTRPFSSPPTSSWWITCTIRGVAARSSSASMRQLLQALFDQGQDGLQEGLQLRVWRRRQFVVAGGNDQVGAILARAQQLAPGQQQLDQHRIGRDDAALAVNT